MPINNPHTESVLTIRWDFQASLAIYIFMNLLLWSLWFFAGMGTPWPLAWTIGAVLVLGIYRLLRPN